MDSEIIKLKELYSLKSKHSNYQILSRKLSKLIQSNELSTNSRYEQERLQYISENIELKHKTVLDIGGNSGYFTFESVELGAEKVHYYEGNSAHAEFVRLAVQVLRLESKVDVSAQYFLFDDETNYRGDIAFLLNVLHHVGDDYGNNKLSIIEAKNSILNCLNSLSNSVNTLVFQLGFNWKGNRDAALFKNGTKKELIDFIKEGTSSYWDIVKIGIAESKTLNGDIIYSDLNENNMLRADHLGEFLNRPLFIMSSKKFKPNSTHT
jgi:SAM-dependent methyltransferase